MTPEFLQLLRCPQSGQQLVLESSTVNSSPEGEIESGWLVSEDGNYRYPIKNNIPRFVPENNYADNFGMQWNHFAKTQLDSHSGHPISSERFWNATGWQSKDLCGKWVLDVGCGSGRFAEIALSTGANVVALDYSSAVDACYSNLKKHPNLHIVQGDIYALPFALETFSFVYSLGVLQHTPDVEKAFNSLPPMLKDGGRLCVDYYEKSAMSRFFPKYWLRPLTKRLPKKKLFTTLQLLVPIMLPISRLTSSIPVLGKYLKRLIPVANLDGIAPLDKQQQIEWSLLDTFDWFSPAYDNPQTAETARTWLERAMLKEIEVKKAGHLVGRGIKRDDLNK
ncbi:MAG: class I SAM-dependent methyltransferase [Gammaproteobacteria bacterium]|nr:MAG: class I SAM-dependent methyltransferase [Gammaproteobacteria bacterium]